MRSIFGLKSYRHSVFSMYQAFFFKYKNGNKLSDIFCITSNITKKKWYTSGSKIRFKKVFLSPYLYEVGSKQASVGR